MDSKLYRELSEAYLNVYAPKEILESKDEEEKEEEEEEDTKKKSSKKGEDEEEDEDEMEEMGEAVENLDEISANLALTASQKADEERRKASVSGDKATAAKKAAQASRLYKGVGPRRTRERMGGMKEEVDVYDEVIEFLCVEGYAETLEEAEWMMANIIDEEAIDIILGEADSLAAMQARREKRQKANMKKHGTPGFDYSKPPSGKKGYLDAITKKEEFEAWLDEAMSNYEKNRKRAAQRAAARNAARDQGKTGAVPGVGYVTPRRERETWTDEKGKTRHAKGL